ncbi:MULTISPECIES: transposase [Mycobacterium avium complex (MAC)]|uniref:transposase n=1 Tax=Mycobacterium avium complex (MAC) TaxID=120793 RepID=UPI00044EAB14|nr:putative transposase, mobile genetic element MH21 [Mycobacterium intracellulare MIN_052511_1280]
MSEMIWPPDAVTHMWDHHQTTVAMAAEALDDPDVVAFIPDPKSRSGKSSRFIGYSPTAERLLVVIVVDHHGQHYGANCWPANPTDQRIYRERTEQ